MYHELDGSEGPVLGIELTETVTESDLRSLAQRIDAVVAEHGRVCLLVRCDSLPRPEFAAVEDELAFWGSYRDVIERFAVVSDGRLVAWTTELSDHLTRTPIRHFEPSSTGTAWEWLRAGAGQTEGESGTEGAEGTGGATGETDGE